MEVLKKYVFNRRKKDTIILIHGLYTSSGFWLSFFKQFKNFKIIAFDINYDKLLNCEYSREFIKSKFLVDEHIVGVISHSFGTVLSDIIFEKKSEIVYKICPIGFSKRIDTNDFVLDIINKTALSKDLISNTMKLASLFVSNTRNILTCNGEIYIPSNDIFFSYDIPKKKNIEFNGDHFNIYNALNDIIDKIMKSNIID